MDEAAAQPESAQDTDRCTRCLQPIAHRATRCPGCGQPHTSRRYLPLLVGVAGIFALAFAMALMYFAAWRSDMANADPLVDEQSQKQEIMVETPAETGKPAREAKPDKPPPLNEK